MADTIKSEIEESLAPATEELVSLVIEPGGTDVAELLRRFPEVAELLRETTRFLLLEPTEDLLDPPAEVQPMEKTDPIGDAEASAGLEKTGTLGRGRALDICRQFEADLKHRRSPRIEDLVQDVVEPQRSALLAMLLAAELRFHVRCGERPRREEYRGRFADYGDLVEAVLITAVGPERIGAFIVVKLLGEGNFGRVYLCRDEQLDRLVAIKVPRSDRFAGPADVDRFLHEAKLAARVKHPGIVTVHQVDRDKLVGGFVVLEYIEGRSLSTLLHDERLAPERAAQLLVLTADALSFAHEQGLVHRDLKPDNILMDKRDRPHIADFGLAVHNDDRWPRRGEVAGTPHYMAPEQVRGESHRLDGRTDLWALGVILYRMLTGHRPFDGNSISDVFDEILNREPIPPRQRDRTIPKGLERICLKCLSKRMSDRYVTAADLVDDLRFWIRTAEAGTVANTMAPPSSPSDGLQSTHVQSLFAPDSLLVAPVRVRPKGLRAFDRDDRDFFLNLLPGPRDRDGLPESLRFWKARIEPGDYDDPFAVGLLCGPSGSGKTSMVKAGLLCRLSPADVTTVYVEASPGATETRLLTALRRVAGSGADKLSLPETVAGIRSRALLPSGPKVLIVLDQFEQWLHADYDSGNAGEELVRALRQCDGTNVQCLVLVRDDFAMAAARFMRALEIRLIENDNFAMVDAFDLTHARRVLREFGLAYDRFREEDHAFFDRFLDLAVAELAEEGKIAPVRLALLAQMLKDKPWTPATLKDMRGLEGIGVKFLEESLDGESANPEYRLNVPASRRVLRALLPHGAADIKGHMKSYDELLAASGYARRPADFDTLLSILGTELRLITPTDPRGADAAAVEQPEQHAERYYHLTHDYLVPSLREWLTRKERETISGRAAIRLGERSAEWATGRSTRYLPTWWEWLVIALFTRPSRRSPPERRLMAAATRYHAARAALVAAALVLIGLFAADRLGAMRAGAAVRELEQAEAHNVPQVIENLTPYRRWADPLLRRTVNSATTEAGQKARARLALLPVDRAQAGELLGPLIDGDADLFLVLRQALYDHGDRSTLANQCREVLRNEREFPDRRLRAGMALAGFLGESQAGQDEDLRKSSDFLARHLVTDLVAHPDRFTDWVAAMQPARSLLAPTLERVFRDASALESARSSAASVLVKFDAEKLDTLTELLLDAHGRQFGVIFDALSGSGATIAPPLTVLATASPSDASSREEKIDFARRQANALIALVRLGSADPLWPHLVMSENPELRSFLIDRLAPFNCPPAILIDRLTKEADTSVRAALLLSMNRYTGEQLPPSERAGLVPRLLGLYQNDPDPAVHSAAGLVLSTWGRGDQLRLANQSLVSARPIGTRRWYIARDGMTMVLLDGKRGYQIGSPDDERWREWRRSAIEDQRFVDVAPFEISTTEVTVAQYRPFLEDDKETRQHYPAPSLANPDWPQAYVTWCEAASYCNWRSQQEGIPRDQWCYEPRPDGKAEPGMTIKADFMLRTGFRLPIEAEWEYACRAGTVTSRYFGNSNELMERYASCLTNSNEIPVTVASFLPNAFGLFDMHGNVFEWCQDIYADKGMSAEQSAGMVEENVGRILRGGGAFTRPSTLRSAMRYRDPPKTRNDASGFRLVRSRPRPEGDRAVQH